MTALQDLADFYAGPGGDAGPPLNAVVPDRLFMLRHPLEIAQGEFQRLFDESTDAQAPVVKSGFGHPR